MNQKHKNVLNYIEHSLIAIYTITRCISSSVFASIAGIPIEIASSKIGLKICVITPGIKKCKPIIKKNRKKHDQIISLAKSRLNNIEVLTSKALILVKMNSF